MDALLEAPLDDLLAAARERRSARVRGRARHLLAQGLHPADDALPRRLRLLHLRAAAPSRRAGLPDRGRGARDRPCRRCGRLHGGALHARRQAGAPLQGRARGARRTRLRDDARVPRPCREARARGDGAAAASEPRRDEPGGARARCGRSRRRWGSCSRRSSERLSAKGGPHWASPDKDPAAPPRDDRARRRAADPVHERDPDRDRRDARRAARGARRAARAARAARPPAGGDRPELPRQAGHADGGASGAEPRRSPLDDRGGAARAARTTSPCRRRRTSPTTTSRACSTPASTTGAASRRSRSTTSTPRRPGPTATAWQRRPARAGSSSRRGSPSTRAISSGSWLDPAVLPDCAARSRRARARPRGRLAPGRARRGAVRRPPGRAPARHGRRAGGGGARPPLPRPRRGAAARLRRRRPAAARGLRRRGQLRRHPEHPVHERLLLPLRLLRLLEGEARGEPARRAVPRPARGDRPPRAGGVGAGRDRGLPPGRHPSGVHGRVLRVRRRRDQGRAARPAHPRLLGARGLAGRRDARPRARGLPGAAALARPRLAAGDGGRDPRRRGARGHLPGQGHDRAVARRARRGAPRRPALERDDHVRPRRRAGALGAPPAARAGAAGAVGRLHRVRAAAVRAHGGADVAARAGAVRPDLRRVAAPARGRAAGAPPGDHEHPGLVGEARSRGRRGGAPRRCQRPRRDADERVDLALGGLRARAGDAARGDGGADPRERPRRRGSGRRSTPTRRPSGAPPRSAPRRSPSRSTRRSGRRA